MKIKYLVIPLFSLGLICTSCGKKKKAEHKENHVKTEAHGHNHDHGHDHGEHEGHDH